MKQLTSQKYYHQRFDGALLFMALVAIAELKKEAKKGQALTASSRIAILNSNHVDWYIPLSDLKKTTSYILKKAKHNAKISKKFLKNWYLDEEKFTKHCLLINTNHNLSQLDNYSLIKDLKKLIYLYINRLSSSSIIDQFALGSDQIIADLVLAEFKKKKISDKFIKYFTILTAPTSLSFTNQAEIDLLITAAQFKKTKNLEFIDQYQDKYFWLHNNFIDDNILDTAYFLKEIKKFIQSRNNLLLKIKQLKNSPKNNKIKKQKLIRKIKLSKYLQNLLIISDDFAAWQDQRKKSTFWMTHYLSLFLKEITKRTKYSADELKYLLPHELINIFKKPVHQNIIQKRMKDCVYIGTQNSQQLIVKTGLIASLRNIFDQPQTNQTKLNGLVASPGYARGHVKICLSYKDANNLAKGEILVAIMTRPDYIEGIKNAEAIVCEEGGLTSHAALIARELNIPCLIACHNATTNFKDGDLVEIDCKNGYINKI